MTEITIRIPQAGALRLLEESIKAGVSPDRFIAQLIEDRLKRPSAGPSTNPGPAAPAESAVPQMPDLNAAGLSMLRRLAAGAGPARTRAPKKSPAAGRSATSKTQSKKRGRKMR